MTSQRRFPGTLTSLGAALVGRSRETRAVAAALEESLESNLEAATQLIEASIDWQGAPSDSAHHWQALIGRGILGLLSGKIEGALAELVAALERCKPSDSSREGAVAAGFLAIGESLASRPQPAWPAPACARAEAARETSAELRRLLRAVEHYLGIVKAGAAEEPRLLAEQSDHRGANRQAAPGAARRVATLDAELAWIDPPGGKRVSLHRRPVLQRLLRALLAARQSAPGAGVSTAELITEVWPGDRSVFGAQTNRLWVALSTLRKLGLESLLLRDADGYFLDPTVELRWAGAGEAEASPTP